MQTNLRGHDRSHWSACFLQIILHRIIILHINSWPDSLTEVNMALQTFTFAQRHKQKTCMKNTNCQRLHEFYGSFYQPFYIWSMRKHLYVCNDDFNQTLRSFQGLWTTKDKHPDYSWTLPSMFTVNEENEEKREHNLWIKWPVYSFFIWVGRW